MKALMMIVFITAAVYGGVMMYRTNEAVAPVVSDEVLEERDRAATTSEEDMLVQIHDGVSVSPDIRILDLANRSFSGSLKAEIRKLEDLRELDISHNDLTGIPAEIGQLQNLEVLNLSYNPITGLPHEIGNLQNLLTLDLRGTQYSMQDLDVIRNALPASVRIAVD